MDKKSGYGKPPKEHQFRKGQSGNPNGRPRKKQSGGSDSKALLAIDKYMIEFLQRELTIKTEAGTQKVSMSEALIQAQIKSALGGNAHAQKDTLNRVERAEARQAAAAEAAKRLRLERYEFWKAYKEGCKKLTEESIKKDQATPLFPIHPDDVILNDDGTHNVIGPFDPEGRRQAAENMAFRDMLILQHVLDVRLQPDSPPVSNIEGVDDLETVRECDGAMVMAQLIDRQLPPRLRLPYAAWIMKQFKAERMTKRELLKAVPAAMRHLAANGHKTTRNWTRSDIKRGATTMPLSALVRMLAGIVPYMMELMESDELITLEDGERLASIINNARAATN